jgi:hypothetical protein
MYAQPVQPVAVQGQYNAHGQYVQPMYVSGQPMNAQNQDMYYHGHQPMYVQGHQPIYAQGHQPMYGQTIQSQHIGPVVYAQPDGQQQPAYAQPVPQTAGAYPGQKR